MLLIGVKFNAVPLQIVVCNCVDVLVITGTGNTVTVTCMGIALHTPIVAVISYVTVPALMPSVEVNT
jgi:hypothetical protein